MKQTKLKENEKTVLFHIRINRITSSFSMADTITKWWGNWRTRTGRLWRCCTCEVWAGVKTVTMNLCNWVAQRLWRWMFLSETAKAAPPDLVERVLNLDIMSNTISEKDFFKEYLYIEWLIGLFTGTKRLRFRRGVYFLREAGWLTRRRAPSFSVITVGCRIGEIHSHNLMQPLESIKREVNARQRFW